MSDVTVTVRGENEVRIAPERATIHLTVRTEASRRGPAVEAVTQLAEPVRSSLTARRDDGTLVEWSSSRLSVHAERPWSDGKRLALVHRAAIDFTATFADAGELSAWVSEATLWDAVEIGPVDWQLTPETRARVEREVAASAVGVAVARAEAYASALGLARVVPIEVADLGLLSDASAPGAPMLKTARAMAFDASGSTGPVMEYEPEDLTVSAAVEARFTAS